MRGLRHRFPEHGLEVGREAFKRFLKLLWEMPLEDDPGQHFSEDDPQGIDVHSAVDFGRLFTELRSYIRETGVVLLFAVAKKGFNGRDFTKLKSVIFKTSGRTKMFSGFKFPCQVFWRA